MFSVIIPLYNKELSIYNTIQSVLDQTFQAFEIVIINDGSTDNSINVVQQFDDKRIRLIHQDNQGVSAARNRGIEMSKYDWIAFLDGDDLWKEYHLDEILKMMCIFPNEKVYTTTYVYSDNRTLFKHYRNEEIFIIENFFRESLKESLIWSSNVVIKKECFKKVGNFNTQLIRGEDIDVWSRLARCYNIVKSTKVTAIYRVEAENRSDKYISVKKSFIAVDHFKNITDKDEYKFYKMILRNRLIYAIRMRKWYDLFYLVRKFHFYLLTK